MHFTAASLLVLTASLAFPVDNELVTPAVTPLAIIPFVTPTTSIAPAILPGGNDAATASKGIDWSGLLKQSTLFLALEHGFRYSTENGTRHAHRPFFKGYAESVGNLHGWSDGDPFYVNYVGHPMQGAVAGFIWTQNDRRYLGVEFGKNPGYWKSRLRAAAFSFVYSTQFEIGPLSEASIGNTQAYFPQQGFVDHVITPTVGLLWTIAEDALDKHVIERLEAKIKNPYIRLALRGGLNPSRSFANLLRGEVPWVRDTRPDLFPGRFGTSASPRKMRRYSEPPPASNVDDSEPAPFELATTALAASREGGLCVGGGASVGIRMSPRWQYVMAVNGCAQSGLPTGFTGDSLTYMAGLRWTPEAGKRWQPYLELLAGGNKSTVEEEDVAKKAILEADASEQNRKLDFTDHIRYTRQEESNGLAVEAGTGLDWRINRAFAFRVAGVSYNHSWLGGIGSRNRIQLSSGLILRMGRW